MVWISIFKNYKNYIFCNVFRTNFFRFNAKPICWCKKINVSLLIKISSDVLPIRRTLLRYITWPMFNYLNRAIGTFNSFGILLVAGSSLKQRQRKQISNQPNIRNLASYRAKLRNMHLSHLSCRENSFPIWNELVESF